MNLSHRRTKIIAIGSLGFFCLPYLLLKKSDMINYDDHSAPIYVSMSSLENKNAIYILLGICIPLTIDYILDFFYYGSIDNESGFNHRGILLLNAWIPNLLILFSVL